MPSILSYFAIGKRELIQARQLEALKVAEKRKLWSRKEQLILGLFQEHFALGCSLCSNTMVVQFYHHAKIPVMTENPTEAEDGTLSPIDLVTSPDLEPGSPGRG